MKVLKMLVAASVLFIAASGAQADETVDVVSACKKDCPKAESNEEAHKCAEKLGRLNKEFRKSQCWDINEKYEKAQAAGKSGAIEK